jgi:hypothetical protein
MAASSDDLDELVRNSSNDTITTSHTGADLYIADNLRPEDAAMSAIPSPRDPLAPEARVARKGVIWSEADRTDREVTTMIVLRQLPAAQVVSQSRAPRR